MIDIQILGTGSKGNCYVVKIGRATFMLECGLNFKTIQKKLNYKLTREVDACLITHEHL